MLSGFLQHTNNSVCMPGVIRLSLPTPCSNPLWCLAPAANLSLHQWNLKLVRQLIARRKFTVKERKDMKQRLGVKYSAAGAMVYGMLKRTLDDAMNDNVFLQLARRGRGLWMEFGVLTGLSINITSKYMSLLSVPGSVHGFDTFTGVGHMVCVIDLAIP